MRLREWVELIWPTVRASIRHLVGFAGLGAVVAGVWGAFGWPAASIAAGVPFAGFWIYGEARQAAEAWRRGGSA